MTETQEKNGKAEKSQSADLERRIGELERENAALMQQYRSVRVQLEAYIERDLYKEEAGRLSEENASLRSENG